ncbi:MAG: hypothetical protein J6Q77_03325 [Clostridia bacterium]|nr:hypothetical protein [Clostridia bacterium]
MYDITPKRSNKVASYTSTALFVTALIAMLMSGISWLPYRSVMQLAALIILGIAIAILVRYVLTGYSYAIVPAENGGYYLTVTEVKHRSRITVCRISLASIEHTETVRSENKKELAPKVRGYKTFNYCVDLAPSELFCIFANECGESLAIKLSYDQDLIDLISRLCDTEER